MNEIYPLWVAAHGIMIVTPVHWYQATSPLKLMIDRLVCADGGNPDPTRTHGKDAAEAQKIELEGWDYPRHLAGRAFSIVVHGDAEGVLELRRALFDWLTSMGLESAGTAATLDRYIGYWKPYATGHADLDRDTVLQSEVQFAAETLIKKISEMRTRRPAPEEERSPREK
jgi:multimeric flavodoxin WrbA